MNYPLRFKDTMNREGDRRTPNPTPRRIFSNYVLVSVLGFMLTLMLLTNTSNASQRPSLDVGVSSSKRIRLQGVVLGTDSLVSVYLLPYYGREGEDEIPLIVLDRATRGRFQLDIKVPQGPFLILAVSNDFLALRGPFRYPEHAPEVPLLLRSSASSSRGSLVDEHGTPVSSANVSLASIAGFRLPELASGQTTSTTDSQGEFSLSSLPGVSWEIRVEAQGYPKLTLRAEDKQISLPRAQRSSGRIIDSNGLPIEKATIVASGMSGSMRWFSSARSDKEGHFKLQTLKGENAQVLIRKQGFASLARPFRESVPNESFELQNESRLFGALKLPLSSESENETFLVRLYRTHWVSEGDSGDRLVSQQETTGQVVFDQLASGTYSIEVRSRQCGRRFIGPFEVRAGTLFNFGEINIEAPGRLSGVVLDNKSGRPIEGARVRLLAGVYSIVSSKWFPESLTAADGTFEIGGVTDDEFTIEVFKPGYGWQFLSGEQAEKGEPVSQLVVSLKAMSGEVIGKVSDSTKVSGDLISLSFPRSSDKFLWSAPDSTGSYRFSGLPSGEYVVTRFSLSTTSPEQRIVHAGDGSPERTRLNFRESGTLKVTGVIRVGGKPFPGAGIRLIPIDDTSVHIKGPIFQTDEAGQFEMTTRLGAFQPELHLGNAFFMREPVEISSEASRIFIELPNTRLVGTVRDSETGEPLGGARFQGGSGNSFFKGQSDSQGRFSLIGFQPGRCVVTFFSPGYLRGPESKSEVDIGTSPPLDVSLTRGRTVTGRIFDENGLPLRHSYVRAIGLDGGGDGLAKSDNSGYFEIRGLRFSGYSLRILTRTVGAVMDISPGKSDRVVSIEAQQLMKKVLLPGIRGPVDFVELLTPSGAILRRRVKNYVSWDADSNSNMLYLDGLPPGDFLVRVVRNGSVREIHLSVSKKQQQRK